MRLYPTNFETTRAEIPCLEEIAYCNGWIISEDVLRIVELIKNQYGQYLIQLVKRK